MFIISFNQQSNRFLQMKEDYKTLPQMFFSGTNVDFFEATKNNVLCTTTINNELGFDGVDYSPKRLDGVGLYQ